MTRKWLSFRSNTTSSKHPQQMSLTPTSSTMSKSRCSSAVMTKRSSRGTCMTKTYLISKLVRSWTMTKMTSGFSTLYHRPSSRKTSCTILSNRRNKPQSSSRKVARVMNRTKYHCFCRAHLVALLTRLWCMDSIRTLYQQSPIWRISWTRPFSCAKAKSTTKLRK